MAPAFSLDNATGEKRVADTPHRRAAGLALLWDRTTPAGVIIGVLVVMGTGVGNTFQPTLVALQAHTLKSRRAAVISNRNFFRCAGGACGLAVSAAVLQASLRAHLPPQYAYLADNTYALPHIPTGSAGAAFDGVLDAYMAASRAVFILQVPLIGLCFLGCVFIRDRGLEPYEDEPVKKGENSSVDEPKSQVRSRTEEEKTPAAVEEGKAAQTSIDPAGSRRRETSSEKA
jgi:hypothetical protein